MTRKLGLSHRLQGRGSRTRIGSSPLPWEEGGGSSEPGEGFLPTEPGNFRFRVERGHLALDRLLVWTTFSLTTAFDCASLPASTRRARNCAVERASLSLGLKRKTQPKLRQSTYQRCYENAQTTVASQGGLAAICRPNPTEVIRSEQNWRNKAGMCMKTKEEGRKSRSRAVKELRSGTSSPRPCLRPRAGRPKGADNATTSRLLNLSTAKIGGTKPECL